MQAIQRMRLKAQQNGALKSTPEQTVSTSTTNGQSYVSIQPASPEVVYVPQYDPAAVWGASAYPYPSIYYPPPERASFPSEQALLLGQSGVEAGTTGDGTLDGEITVSSSITTSSTEITSTVPM